MNIRGFFAISFEKQSFIWSPEIATSQLSNTNFQVTSNKDTWSNNTMCKKERVSQDFSLWPAPTKQKYAELTLKETGFFFFSLST